MSYISNMVVDRNLDSFDLIVEESLTKFFPRDRYEFARHSFTDRTVSISYIEEMDPR